MKLFSVKNSSKNESKKNQISESLFKARLGMFQMYFSLFTTRHIKKHIFLNRQVLIGLKSFMGHDVQCTYMINL